MAEVIWSARALYELEAIEAYIRNFSPLAAQRVAVRLISAAMSLDASPHRGRSIPGGRRELTHVAPYLIRYRIEGERVTVLEVRHGARAPD